MISVSDHVFRPRGRKKSRDSSNGMLSKSCHPDDSILGYQDVFLMDNSTTASETPSLFKSKVLRRRSKSRGRPPKPKTEGATSTKKCSTPDQNKFKRRVNRLRSKSKDAERPTRSRSFRRSILSRTRSCKETTERSVTQCPSSSNFGDDDDQDNELRSGSRTLRTEGLTSTRSITRTRSTGLESTGDFQLPNIMPPSFPQGSLPDNGSVSSSSSSVSELSMEDPVRLRLYNKNGKIHKDVAASMEVAKRRTLGEEIDSDKKRIVPPIFVCFEPMEVKSSRQLIDI